MVGFPGETEELFQETYDFIARLPFTYLHVFSFSARPGTPAATMPGQVPVPVMRERNRRLRDLIAEKNRTFRTGFLGCRVQAITLSRDSAPGTTDALTDNFLKLTIEGEHAANQWLQVEVTDLTDSGLYGRIA
jgi:threonylcarbamoyladenosine tRNA methylthiotransferase MtaB